MKGSVRSIDTKPARRQNSVMLRALRIEYLGAIYQWPTVCIRPKTKVNRTTNMNSALCKYSGLTPLQPGRAGSPLPAAERGEMFTRQTALRRRARSDAPYRELTARSNSA